MVSFKNLISKGYFPAELVPPFSTKDLGDISDDLENKVNERGLKKWSKCCPFSIPKFKKDRRILSIPNPLHQTILSKEIADYYNELETFFIESNISLSRPEEDLHGERAVVPKIRISDIKNSRILESTSSRYLLITDISRYYSTMYTHSIPWALHTKTIAKDKRGPSLLGNRIDTAVRNTQEQQTQGIPIGPDTSLIISELIGTRVDIELSDNNGEIRGFRYIDDYYLYFDDFTEAEFLLSKLTRLFKQYSLEFNPYKTKIKELPIPIEENWVIELRGFHFTNNILKQKGDVINYFSKAFKFSKSFSDDSVLKYALARIKEILIEKSCWEIYESLILKAMIGNPNVLPIATEIFLTYKDKHYQLNNDRIKKTLQKLILYHAEFRHIYEISWALWLLKSLGINLDHEIATEISNIDDPIIALIALDMRDSNLISNDLEFTIWMNHMVAPDLYTEYWLLAYEAYVKGWLKSKSGKDYISSDPFFSFLKDKNVEFYKPTNQVELIHLYRPKEKLKAKIEAEYPIKDFEEYKDYDKIIKSIDKKLLFMLGY